MGDPKTAKNDSRNAPHVDAEGVVEGYGVFFTMVPGWVGAASGIASKAGYA